MILDFDAILRLTKVLKEASPSLQAKVCCVLEHLAASEQHATAMTATSTGSVIEAILEIGVIHGILLDSVLHSTDGYINLLHGLVMFKDC